MDNAEDSGRGRMATCYLGRQYREAMDIALQRCGWLHSHYVKIAVLEKLHGEGLISDAVLEVEQQRIEYKKTHPHGNSKRAREVSVRTSERTNKEPHEEEHSSAPAHVRGRKLTPRERRERKLRNQTVA